MDAKRVAMVIGITVLLPLFLGLFVDAVYQEPTYDKYCGYNNYRPYPAKVDQNCTYQPVPAENQCSRDGGMPVYNYTEKGCQVYDTCDFCNKQFNDAQQEYNRNIFFILLPVGLIIVILGIYLMIDYLGAGLMFAGLITMFYATIRYFSDMSKVLRALVVLAELLIIMWIGYKKIGSKENSKKILSKSKSRKKK
jgi:uncharacterized protein (DUF983 family)